MSDAKLQYESNSASLLPDLCGANTVLTVMIVSQLLAFILVLANITPFATTHIWSSLGLVSLFVHWVALSSTLILCLMRRALAIMSRQKAAVVSYIIIMVVTFTMSLVVTGIERTLYSHSNPIWGWLFALRNTAISAIVIAIALRFIYLHRQQQIEHNAKASARIAALQARIRPHFLFNSMNTIAALIATRPDDAELAIEDLAELFRASLGKKTDANSVELVSLDTEFHYVKLYLQIEKLRLGDRLKVEWDIHDIPLTVRLPPLTLQPLFENAVYHGIEPLAAGGVIRVNCTIQNHLVNLVIENPKSINRFDQQSDGNNKQGNQMALDNIRERFDYVFGNKGKIYLIEQDDVVKLILNFPVDGDKLVS